MAVFVCLFTVKVTTVPPVPTVPELADGVSQFGAPETTQFTVPLTAATVYWTEFGANGPPCAY
jgi:hypothetical protein